MRRGKKKSIMSIYLVIGGYHGKGAFRVSIKINAKITSGRNINRISRLALFQCKKYNGEIMGNIFMDTIRKRIKNICDGRFLGCIHEGRTQFIILPNGCNLPPPRETKMFNAVRPRFFVAGDLDLYAIVLVKDITPLHWCFDCMLKP